MGFLAENLGSIAVFTVIALLVVLCIRSLIKDHAAGGCGYGKCSECGHGCEWVHTKEFLKKQDLSKNH